ncbi:sensor histidine kinase [Streptacidiphilus monticola]
MAVFGFVAGSTLLLRRRWPLLPVAAALATIPLGAGYLLLMVGLYTLAAYRPAGPAGRFAERRAMTVLCAVAITETVVVSVLTMGTQQAEALQHGVPSYALLILSVLAAVGISVPPAILGLYGERRRLWVALTERAEGLETELALLAEQAAERARRARMEERTRIAREMHDVVAHRVSLLVVHAGALERIAARDPEKAAANAKLMGDIGRQALDELRQILGVLRTVDEPSAEELPELGLHSVAALVDELRAAGLPVRYTLGGARRLLSEEAERTAYRVVQEALTNVLKHAPGAEAEVVVAYVPGGVALAVTNSCPGGEASPRALPSGATAWSACGSGSPHSAARSPRARPRRAASGWRRGWCRPRPRCRTCPRGPRGGCFLGLACAAVALGRRGPGAATDCPPSSSSTSRWARSWRSW